MKNFITLLAVIFTASISYTIAQTQKGNVPKFTFEEVTSENDSTKWEFVELGRSRTVIEFFIFGQGITKYSVALAHTDEQYSDTTIVEKYYFLPDAKAQQAECIGCVSLDVPSFLLSVPKGGITPDQARTAVDSFMQPYLNKTNNERSQALKQAANDSRKRLEKKVGSLSVSRYNINSDKGIFKYSGILSEPFDFMEEAAIDEYIAKKAKKFKYTKSTRKADIKKAMLNGDPETIEFVNTYLNDEIEF